MFLWRWLTLCQLISAAVGTLQLLSADATQGPDLDEQLAGSDAQFWRDYYARLRKIQQPLDNNTSVELAVQAGQTAALSCPVRNLGTRPVSWIRRRDFHVVSSRDVVFSGDSRFSVRHHGPGGADEDWTLVLKRAESNDSGVYECQVSTGRGTLSRLVNLTVVVPSARLVGATVYRIEKGSVITLLCVIDGALTAVDEIRWRLDGHPVQAGGRVQLDTMTAARGQTAPRSQLHVSGVTFLDSGVYSCGGDFLQSASVQVFVTEGDKTAAIQRRSAADGGPWPSAGATLLVLLALLVVR